jgi:glycosyltransferase involved in cell wall biosynthesis
LPDKVIVVIPSYRTSDRIRPVIIESLKYADTVIVSDDNSGDDTALVATQAGAQVVHPLYTPSHGVGSNTWCGIWYALHQGADIIVTLDSDGQHDPADIPVLVKAIQDGADVAIGSRFPEGIHSMPLSNRIVNQVLTWMSNLGVPQEKRITDSQCGFRAFRAEVFRDIRTSENKFGFITETLVKAYKARLIVAECPVRCIYHNNRASNSSMNRISHGVLLVISVVKWRIWEKLGA